MAHAAPRQETDLFEELRASLACPPAALVEAAASLRVRVMRDDLDTHDRTRTTDVPIAAVEPIVEWVRERLRPGDAVRVEWLDGSGAPLPLGGTKGRFTRPKERPVSSPERPPERVVVDVASAPVPSPPASAPPAATALTTAANALERAPATGDPADRLLVAGLGHGAAGMSLAQQLVGGLLERIDRQTATIERLAATCGTALADVAKSNARMVEAAHAPAKPLADALVARQCAQEELVGHLLGRGDAAQLALVEARVAEERARAAPRLDAEGNPLPPADGDGTATIKALAEVLREGKSLVRGSAEEAVAEMLGKVAKGGKVPPKVAKVLDSLTPEQKTALGITIASALAPK